MKSAEFSLQYWFNTDTTERRSLYTENCHLRYYVWPKQGQNWTVFCVRMQFHRYFRLCIQNCALDLDSPFYLKNFYAHDLLLRE